MHRLHSLIDWIRRSPLRAGLTAAAVIAAIGAGVAFGIVANGLRDTGGVGAAPTDTPPPSLDATEPASPTAEATDPAPSPTQEPSATAVPADQPSPTVASTATPASTPTDGFGGMPMPDPDITGTWATLAPMPGGADFMVADSLWLPDGRIAVFRWDYGSEDPSEPEVLAYHPATDAWEVVGFDGPRPFIGTAQPFALGGDDRIYTFEERIDPSAEPWRSEPFELIRETDVWAGTGLAAAGDGRIYRRADDVCCGRTELIAYDPISETFERTSSVEGRWDLPYAAPDGSLVLLGTHAGERALITYDPVADAWGRATAVPGWLAEWHAAIDADGRAYLPVSDSSVPQLYAIDIDDGTPLTVATPDAAATWDVDLLWDPDGRLFVFGREEAWVFTPDR